VGLGHSALDTGLLSFPFAVGSILSSMVSGRISHALGRGVLLLGTGALAVGLGWIALDLSFRAPDDVSTWTLAAPLLLGGLGSGLFIAPNAQFIVATVMPQETGAASAVTATMQRLGTALGLAVVATVFYSLIPASATEQDYTSSAAISIGVCALLAALSFGLVFALPLHTRR
jgi:MFS family permease